MRDKKATEQHATMDLKTLGAMPFKEALPIIMEQYQVDKKRALLLWTNNRAPTGFEDVVALPPEEFKEYMQELKRTSLGGFKIRRAKKTD